ncbi:porin family protein [Flavobacterium silvaticum]|uniref:PorT family protein n=1 Tax=Flavobacterium silvaticum TaxID=1852020 RepID=A0A972FRL9_9FLAO|nr:porin family protein [Flavobacterium silvaticum]NMH28099.1 PorT family protein [Flavobacterium silvaticum]
MKKLLVLLLISVSFGTQAQFLRFGFKAGPNFSNFNGGVSGIDYKGKTGFHAGALVQLKLLDNFALQPELLYSSQGAEVKDAGDFNLNYISVPVLAKFFVVSDKLSIDVGPQFSFLVDDTKLVYNQISGSESGESFDFALAGGLGVHLTKSIWVQARYTIGLTEASSSAEVKNAVFQVSGAFVF